MKEESLFSLANQNENTPLADRVRPQNLDDFVGQENLIGHGKILRDLIEKDRVPSLILWGPPGQAKLLWQKLSLKELRHISLLLVQLLLQSNIFVRLWNKQSRIVSLVKEPLSLLMKFTVLIRHNKMLFYHL